MNAVSNRSRWWHQLVDLVTGQVSPPGELAEHTFAVGACLVDHLPTLLLGDVHLVLRQLGSLAAAPRRLHLGILPEAGRLLGCLAEHRRRALLGPSADLSSTLVRGVHDARRLLAEQA